MRAASRTLDSGSDASLAGLHPWFDDESRELPESVRHKMRVALEEAVMNVAMHAYPPGASGDIIITLEQSPGLVTLRIEDLGRAFDPSDEPSRKAPASLSDAEPGGLGLSLLHHFCQDITHRRKGLRNTLTLRFPVPGP